MNSPCKQIEQRLAQRLQRKPVDTPQNSKLPSSLETCGSSTCCATCSANRLGARRTRALHLLSAAWRLSHLTYLPLTVRRPCTGSWHWSRGLLSRTYNNTRRPGRGRAKTTELLRALQARQLKTPSSHGRVRWALADLTGPKPKPRSQSGSCSLGSGR